ncbi:PhoX family protein [Agromyces binzhouensis]|uniref:PhoX family phosphatase n=1 Tax=Agromyces binzhouensis TaxID=1817495 RepID=A0A4Q2JTM1_9MICO|nr:PhoX family phosphatase [Agromyces binzhouensis]RXZ51572.1 PhoX family phosphatase [Agromyces binzhouensis]
MTIPELRLTPVSHAIGKRSPVTCRLKCADACLGPECNTSSNAHFRDIASQAISRRSVLGLGVAGAVGLVVGGAAGGSAGPAFAAKPGTAGLSFSPIAPVDRTVDAFTVPAGYRWQPIIRWGDPLFSSVPAFDFDHQTAEAQAGQFGYNNDYLDIIADPSGKTGVLVTNHEYVNPDLMFTPTTDPEERRRRGEIYKAAMGMAVVEVKRRRVGDPWEYVVDGARSRRITVESVFELTGPAAGSDLVTTAADPEGRWVKGTLGNCAGGTTPWGTVLSGEENFNGYFAWAADTAEQRRYSGSSTTATETGWEQYDERFDAHDPRYVNEPNRFGYIVEIDPSDPTSTPKKHTAMGRFKHEGANVTIAEDGRVVAYMGDDERNDYLYKFVSKGRYTAATSTGARRKNMTLLSEGDLFVARFSGNSPAAEITGTGAMPSDGAFDGTGEWIALTRGGESVVPGMTTEQVLVYTRLAADLMGATKMDRPEDVEPNPLTGKVYLALTNNSRRTVATLDEVNPITGNRYGHVVELTETSGQAGETFGWSILLLCGDPAVTDYTYFAGFPKELVSPISCPDNVAFDSEGNLWISTDGAPSTIGYNDGLFRVPLEGDQRGNVQQFLAVPREAETCGPVIHDREGLVFVAVQHPGENGAVGAQTSYFPDYVATHSGDKVAAPRPSVVQVWKG